MHHILLKLQRQCCLPLCIRVPCAVQVRNLGEGERDTERGPASPLPAKKPSLLKRAYDLTMGNPADSTASSARRAGAGTAFSIMEPQYAEMDRQTADKKARR